MAGLLYPASLKSVTLHKPAPSRRYIFGAVLLALYAICITWSMNTMGEPLAIALEQMKKTQVDDRLKEFDDWGSSEDEDEEEADEDELEAVESTADATKKAAIKDPSLDDDERPLPSAYLPNAWAAACTLFLVLGHALFHLMCHWSTKFRVAALFTKDTRLEVGSCMHVVPHAHKGKSAVCAITRSRRTKHLEFMFQRQKYEVFLPGDAPEPEEDEPPLVGGGEVGTVRFSHSPVNLVLHDYLGAKGLDAEQVALRYERYGKNSLSLKPPTLPSLLLQQLISPISIFQLFSSLLWLLDAYWQYMVFTCFTLCIMSGTTAFQRLRTMKVLNGMNSKASPVRVFRQRKWLLVSTEDLVPGDLISLTLKRSGTPAAAPVVAAGGKAAPPKATVNDVVPCDCLILGGNAVVNEATLTGESVPQMKDALRASSGVEDRGRKLMLEGRDRIHVLFSGTTLMSCTPGPCPDESIVAPDGGCVCYVLRTGFSSSQGGLMQMIEYSTHQVSSDSKETLMALLLLLGFALVAAGYVLKKGQEKGELTTHELLLRCVIILTSVVPTELPMQMSVSINAALMKLMKAGVMCIEPFRVPFAGKISYCLFDKTGTLTTDQLVPVGVVCATGGGGGGGAQAEEVVPYVKMEEASEEVTMVLSACHSLISIEGTGGKLVGDPIELAALRGVKWQYDSKAQTARPGGAVKAGELALAQLKEELKKALADKTKAAQERAQSLQGRVQTMADSLFKERQRASAGQLREISLEQRFHFSSQLQRMSVLCRVKGSQGMVPSGNSLCVLTKGSPEALKGLIASHTLPTYFDATYRSLAEAGMRVLCLAYKWVDSSVPAKQQRDREWAEGGLTFAGFIAFACKTRADSPMVVQALSDAGHWVSMVTGDASLTALHVAKEVNIVCAVDKRPSLMLCAEGGEEKEDSDGKGEGKAVEVFWRPALGAPKASERIPFAVGGVKELSQRYELLVEERALEAAAMLNGEDEVFAQCDCIRVFARMSPPGKAKVCRHLQKKEIFVLMCGDGGNDVGALKQADVGLALLSGYGNSNTDASATEVVSPGAVVAAGGKAGKKMNAEEKLNMATKKIAARAGEQAKVMKAALAKKQKEVQGLQKQWLAEELDRMKAAGQGEGIMANMGAMKKVFARMQQEIAKERRRLQKLHGNAFDDKAAAAAKDPMAAMTAAMEDSEAMPIVRPGDASVAAPFTSRAPSVKSVVDLIRQGRCTLLSTLQQQQIMMLQCMISAYTLSALSLEGARTSERQMMVSGWLLMTASLAFSYSSPIESMSSIRPLRSIFHPAIILSIAGQAAIHLGCMVYAVKMATDEMGPELLKEVIQFHKKVKLGTAEAVVDEDDPLGDIMAMWSTPFMPNLMNTVVFLVETSQMVAVLFVNYKGRPWMKGLLENHPLFLSIFACAGGVAAAAWGISPEVNAMIHLVPFPNDDFRWRVMLLVFLSLVGTFIWDRFITAIFAPRVFKAMMAEAGRTTLADLLPIFKTLGKVCGALIILGTGNIFVMLGLFWVYRKWNASRKAEETKALLAS